MLFVALNMITNGLHTIANMPLSKRKKSFTIAISIRFEGDNFCSKRKNIHWPSDGLSLYILFISLPQAKPTPLSGSEYIHQ